MTQDILFRTLVKGITVKIPRIAVFKTELRPPTEYYSPHHKKKYMTGKRYVLKIDIMRSIKDAFRNKKVY